MTLNPMSIAAKSPCIGNFGTGNLRFGASYRPTGSYPKMGVMAGLAIIQNLPTKLESNQRSCEVQPFSSGCSEILRVFPSGSLNQATFAPVGEVQILNSS